jgi:hypothetical protein
MYQDFEAMSAHHSSSEDMEPSLNMLEPKELLESRRGSMRTVLPSDPVLVF